MVQELSEQELFELVGSFPEVHLFLGYGERAQYADVEAVLGQLEPYLRRIEQRCGEKEFLAVFGGDKSNQERPDLGWLMHCIREKFNCKLLAIQAAGQPDKHCDYGFVAEQQFETATRANAQGVMEEVQQVLYGGTRDGKPVGGTRYYLGPRFIQKSASKAALLTAMFVMGGGGVALDEIKYADEQDVPWVYIPSAARNEDAYKSRYGPVHAWVHGRLDEGPEAGKKYLSVKGGNTL